jgi:hypothetical protein
MVAIALSLDQNEYAEGAAIWGTTGEESSTLVNGEKR